MPPFNSQRSDYELLERRVAKLEQVVRQQDATIASLQARLDFPLHHEPVPRPSLPLPTRAPVGAMPPHEGFRRERSRSPRRNRALGFTPLVPVKPAPPVKPPPLPAPAGGRTAVREFAKANGLDDKCLEALNSQPLEVQQLVINQGPAEGRNPSAMVMSRIARAAAGFNASPVGPNLPDEVEDFIEANGLDEKCAESLRSQTADCQAAVLAQGPADGRNASAMVMGRIAKFARNEL